MKNHHLQDTRPLTAAQLAEAAMLLGYAHGILGLVASPSEIADEINKLDGCVGADVPGHLVALYIKERAQALSEAATLGA